MNHHPMTPHGGMDDMADHAMHTAEGGRRIDTHRITAACSGPCNQGRKACPCPDACEAEEDAPHVSGAISVCVWLVLAFLAVAACWHAVEVLL